MAKYICFSLLTTGLLLQPGMTETFAASASQNLPGMGALALNTSETQEDLQAALLTRIQNLPTPVSAEAEGVVINERELTLDIGTSARLQLLDSNGAKVDNVKWYCVAKFFRL